MLALFQTIMNKTFPLSEEQKRELCELNKIEFPSSPSQVFRFSDLLRLTFCYKTNFEICQQIQFVVMKFDFTINLAKTCPLSR